MSQPAKSRWPRIRKFFNDVHLWLGLASGLIVIAVCFSGTAYVYSTELTEASLSHLYKVSPQQGQTALPVDTLVARLKSRQEGALTGATIPASPTRSYQFTLKKEGSERGTTYMVNPYTGDILGNNTEKSRTKEFMSKMFSLHRWLMLDKVEKPIVSGMSNRELGSTITGWATILFTLGCITGLIIWFPQKVKHWRQGLKVKWRASWKRVNHDLHNTLAFYALFFLLLMGLTGPQWSFDWYRTGLQKTLGTYQPKDAPKEKPLRSTSPENGDTTATLSLQVYLTAAQTALPGSGDYQVSLPAQAKGTVNISKYHTGFFAPAAADRLQLDQFSAQLLKKDIFTEKPFNQRVAGSIKAIHVGNVYGKFTKLIYFLACLIATSLPVTGTLIWINKMKKKGRKDKTRKVKAVQEMLIAEEA